MIRNSILTFLFIFGFTPIVDAQSGLTLYDDLNMGMHKVGIKQYTRNQSNNETTRVLDFLIWYPASSQGKKLSFAFYNNYRHEPFNNGLLDDLSTKISGTKNALPKDSLERLLQIPIKAYLLAKNKKGKYPLLIWSMRYGTFQYQNLISEYLASHGYVVAFVQDYPNSPFPWQLSSSEEKESTLNQQIADINFAIDHFKQQPNIDSDKIGLLSWSYAGESAILTQMNNPDVDVVVGLSAIGFSYGVYLGSELPNKVSIDHLQVPYLILTERIGTNGKERNPPNIFNQMHPDSRYISFNDLAHGNFNVVEGMIPGILNTNKVQSWSKGGKLAKLGYETICKTTLSFINEVLQQSNPTSFDHQMMELSKTLPTDFISVTRPKDKK